jgi:hypothetical protein
LVLADASGAIRRRFWGGPREAVELQLLVSGCKPEREPLDGPFWEFPLRNYDEFRVVNPPFLLRFRSVGCKPVLVFLKPLLQPRVAYMHEADDGHERGSFRIPPEIHD